MDITSQVGRQYERVPNGWRCDWCGLTVQNRKRHTDQHEAVAVEVIEGFMAEVLPAQN